MRRCGIFAGEFKLCRLNLIFLVGLARGFELVFGWNPGVYDLKIGIPQTASNKFPTIRIINNAASITLELCKTFHWGNPFIELAGQAEWVVCSLSANAGHLFTVSF
jgi:hypothetical protein